MSKDGYKLYAMYVKDETPEVGVYQVEKRIYMENFLF